LKPIRRSPGTPRGLGGSAMNLVCWPEALIAMSVTLDELRCWVEEPGCIEPGRRPGDAAGLRERKQPRFAKFCALPQSGLIIDVLWHYVRHLPRYAGSERGAWSLSCLPGTQARREDRH
jgi:hypothetical protein